VWHDMFAQQIPFAEKILRTVLVYALVAILIRITGKRSLAGLNSLDIVVMLLLSNVVQNSIIGNDLSVTGGAIGAVTLIAVDAALNRAAASYDLFARIFDGTPTAVIEHGTILTRAMHRLGLTRSSLDHAVRVQNGDDISQVDNGVLTPDGQLLLTLRPEEQSATKGDIDRLRDQLARIEAALATR
jgi:uncharacterized membrane protein YcaP (DUF421 family)